MHSCTKTTLHHLICFLKDNIIARSIGSKLITYIIINYIIDPGPPYNLSVQKVAASTALIRWHAPRVPNGIILLYELSYYNVSDEVRYACHLNVLCCPLYKNCPLLGSLIVMENERYYELSFVKRLPSSRTGRVP